MQEKDKITFTGSHPDSLCRVPMSEADERRGLGSSLLRLARWPAALLAVCFAMALFIYYVMPDSTESSLADGNQTLWEGALAGQFRHRPELPPDQDVFRQHAPSDASVQSGPNEINFQQSQSEDLAKYVPNPTFPSTVKPEVRYGNEKQQGLGRERDSKSDSRLFPDPRNTSYASLTNSNRINKDLSCQSSKYDVCKHLLPYDLVKSSPNAPMALTDKEMKTLEEEFLKYNETGCSKRMLSFLCHVMEPECVPYGEEARKPCKKFCIDAVSSCATPISSRSALLNLVNCALYPITDCVQPREPCFEGESACGDGTCYPVANKCDGFFDCPNRMDEKDCNKCNETHWKCRQGECVPMRWLCDGYADCPLGDDEFRCRSGPDGFLPHPIASDSMLPKWLTNLLTHTNVDNKYEGAESRIPSYKQIMAEMLFPDSMRVKSHDLITRPDYLRSDVDSRELLETSDSSSRARPFMRNYGKGIANIPRPLMYSVKSDKAKGNSDSLNIDTDEFKVPYVSMIDGGTKTGPSKDDVAIFKGLIDDLEEIVDSDKWYERSTKLPAEKTGVEDRSGAGTAHASPCPAGELRCVDGRCILYSQLCDGHTDCSDDADERNCRA